MLEFLRQREKQSGKENSLVVMEEFKLVSQSAKISGEYFKRKESTLQKIERIPGIL